MSQIAVLTLLLAGLGGGAWAAETPRRVLILPLDVYADQDLGFLQKGIEEMLITRLSVPGKIQPLEKAVARQARESFSGPLSEALAASLGQEFDADYVLYGSLTVFGGSISTDARFFDVQATKTVVTFAKTGETPGDVIEHVNLFAAQVNDEVFGRRQAEYEAPAASSTENRSRMHPDRLWLEESAKMEQAFVAPGSSEGGVPFTIWRSRNFTGAITGLAVGDLDGDGHNEVAMILERQILIYRFLNQQFARVTEFQGQASDVFLGVDAADINANGKAELFVTSRNEVQQRLNSFVLEWDGRQMSKIADSPGWFLRVVEDPDLGKILLGQGKGARSTFAPQIYRLNWDGQSYVAGDLRNVPRVIPGVFGLNYGDVRNDGQTELVGIDSDDRLQVFSADGEALWTAPDPMVGGTNYVQRDGQGLETDTRRERAQGVRLVRDYLPQRVHVADLEGDGRNEVFVASNDDATGRVLPNLRVFRGGHVACLVWDQIGLRPLWKTREIADQVADTAVADFDNDGQLDLVFASVARRGLLSGKARSSLYAWKPNPSQSQDQSAQ
ncbi:MAG: VCBS repeat-containing protein [Desulfobacterales bacterium]